MRSLRVLVVAALLPVVALPPMAVAVEPSEVLADPALEARARLLSKDLRCLVCRNESIDESNAPLAKDLRVLVRERLVAGDSDAEVMDYVVDRFGEYVLLNPKRDGSNLLLWLAGPLMLVVGLGGAFLYLRGRRPEAAASGATAPQALSPEEAARLAELMREDR